MANPRHESHADGEAQQRVPVGSEVAQAHLERLEGKELKQDRDQAGQGQAQANRARPEVTARGGARRGKDGKERIERDIGELKHQVRHEDRQCRAIGELTECRFLGVTELRVACGARVLVAVGF